MIKMSVFYPYEAGKRFDIAYYCNTHMPLVREKLGAVVKSIAVEHGVAGEQPGSPPAFIAIGHLYFDSVEAFQRAFAPHAEAILADIPNYTPIAPIIQFSEVKM